MSIKPLAEVYTPVSEEAPAVFENRNLAAVYVSLPLQPMYGYASLNPILRLREMKVRFALRQPAKDVS